MVRGYPARVTTANDTTPTDVLDFWLGPLGADGLPDDAHVKRWWTKDPAFDGTCAERFGAALDRAGRGELDGWAATEDGRVALVVVLDQLSRNIHRDTPRAFAGDARALALAEEGRGQGLFERLPIIHAYFLAMPFMHAETVEAQRTCVALFTALRDRAPSEDARQLLAMGVDFAEKHRVIVERFGRFPHRNRILGRPSTPEEIAFLEQPGSSF